jgi:hypothetical protein
MDPTVKSAFEEVLWRFDAFDAKWEAKLSGAETASQERATVVDRRFTALEGSYSVVPVLQTRVSTLEEFCSDQSL